MKKVRQNLSFDLLYSYVFPDFLVLIKSEGSCDHSLTFKVPSTLGYYSLLWR